MKIWPVLVAIGGLCVPAYAQQPAYRTQAREIFSRAIGFRTAEGHQQTGPMVAYLTEVLKTGGVPDSAIATLTEGEATAMIVKLPGRGRLRPIIFTSHMDVVDARPEDWTRDPFTLIEEKGVFFGRGTSDNKAGVVALVSTILRLQAGGLQPERDLIFVFVGDEETNMLTTRQLVKHPWIRDAEFAINTDAGGGFLDKNGKDLIYLIQGAEKTYLTFELSVGNPGGHSSRPRADNAIYQLAHALIKVEAYRFPVMANALTREYLGAVGRVSPGEVGDALRKFSANPEDAAAAEVLWNTPEFVGTTRTTCVTTLLNAGHAENALPQAAKATVNCRVFPGVSVKTVQDALTAAIDDPAVKISILGTPTTSPVSEMRPDVAAAIAHAVHATHPGVAIVPYLESAGTDGKIYRNAGIPTFGSSGSFVDPDETYAHGLNERLPVVAFDEGLDHIYELAVTLGKVRPARPARSAP